MIHPKPPLPHSRYKFISGNFRIHINNYDYKKISDFTKGEGNTHRKDVVPRKVPGNLCYLTYLRALESMFNVILTKFEIDLLKQTLYIILRETIAVIDNTQ